MKCWYCDLALIMFKTIEVTANCKIYRNSLFERNQYSTDGNGYWNILCVLLNTDITNEVLENGFDCSILTSSCNAHD